MKRRHSLESENDSRDNVQRLFASASALRNDAVHLANAAITLTNRDMDAALVEQIMVHANALRDRADVALADAKAASEVHHAMVKRNNMLLANIGRWISYR